MKTTMNKSIRKTIPRKIWITVAILTVLAIMIIKHRQTSSDSTNKDNALTFDVRRGSLIISITEPGTIEAQDKIVIKSEIEGRTTILWIIDEGARVKKGDLLVELDSSELEDRLFTRQLQVQSAQSAFIRTREDLAITKNQAESDIEKAKTTFRFAQQDQEKYIKGEYPQQLRESEARITLAKEDLQRAEEKLKWSRVLFEQKLISQTELQADALASKKATLELELARGKKTLLEQHTNTRELAELTSDIKQSEMALERITRKAKSNILQTETDLTTKEAELKRQSDKLKEIEKQIKATHINAPSDGLVLYATSTSSRNWRNNQEPLAAGSSVREREALIHLPDTTKMMASIKIHETSVKKLTINMPACITVDAIPNTNFKGHVNKIAPLPDPSSFWMNPDLKVYNTEIYIDNTANDLRNGMTCEVEIIVETLTNALYIPLQSVVKTNNKTTAFIVNKHGKIEKRIIKTGSDNSRMIHVISGLKEGERVLLAPPLINSERPDVLERNMSRRKLEGAEARRSEVGSRKSEDKEHGDKDK